MTVRIKYIGHFRPNQELEVPDEKVSELLKTGEYMLIEDGTGIIHHQKKKK